MKCTQSLGRGFLCYKAHTGAIITPRGRIWAKNRFLVRVLNWCSPNVELKATMFKPPAHRTSLYAWENVCMRMVFNWWLFLVFWTLVFLEVGEDVKSAKICVENQIPFSQSCLSTPPKAYQGHLNRCTMVISLFSIYFNDAIAFPCHSLAWRQYVRMSWTFPSQTATKQSGAPKTPRWYEMLRNFSSIQPHI